MNFDALENEELIDTFDALAKEALVATNEALENDELIEKFDALAKDDEIETLLLKDIGAHDALTA